MIELNDKDLIRKILAGEINALQQIIDRYKRQGFNLAYRICRNRENAEEVLQDVFINIYKNLHTFNFNGKFSTWFYRIVYNQSISYIRKSKIKSVSLDQPEINISPVESYKNIDVLLENSEAEKYLVVALGELAPDERALIHLYYYDDKKIADISKITGLSESGIKTKLFRARKKLFSILKRLLKKEFIDFYG